MFRMKKELTDSRIKAAIATAKAEQRPIALYDAGKTPGLGLRANPGGSASWAFLGSLLGKSAVAKKIGRPPALVADEHTLHQIRMLGTIQCTIAEAAGVLGVHENTFATFLSPNGSKVARDTWDHGRANGKMSVRRKQFQVAMSGNIAMLIWWGKNNLGQSDKLENKVDSRLDATLSTSVAGAGFGQHGQSQRGAARVRALPAQAG
jgi:hypothetical protein